MNFKFLSNNKSDLINLITFILISALGLINIIIFATFKDLYLTLTMVIINIIIISLALTAYLSKVSLIYIVIGVIEIVLNSYTNSSTVSFVYFYLISAIIAILGGLIITIFMIYNKELPLVKKLLFGLLPLVIALGSLITVVSYDQIDRNKDTTSLNTWNVPSFIDSKEATNKGKVENLIYETKAYATDSRKVNKKVNVYLPYGYDENNQYDILYLMHGTGDNENYWLVNHRDNVTMLDNLIEQKIIKPIIVVTPTFYVEDDCKNDLDKLTYSFKDELKNDLVPFIENKYSTFALDNTPQSYIDSRDHRAFAGLSRGAVTMFHSALCSSLDYFSYFGAFSGSRTTGEELNKAISSESFDNYPINYLYMTSGTLDFATSLAIKQYNEFKNIDNKFSSSNLRLDITPIKSHEYANWHLNLYNFLQLIY